MYRSRYLEKIKLKRGAEPRAVDVPVLAPKPNAYERAISKYTATTCASYISSADIGAWLQKGVMRVR